MTTRLESLAVLRISLCEHWGKWQNSCLAMATDNPAKILAAANAWRSLDEWVSGASVAASALDETALFEELYFLDSVLKDQGTLVLLPLIDSALAHEHCDPGRELILNIARMRLGA